MSIKKIPICPFCHSEMSKIEDFEYRDAYIPTQLRLSQEGDWKQIQRDLPLNMFQCKKCGFVAFWRGEPE